MLSADVIWAGIYAFVTTFFTAIGGQFIQLSGTQTGIGKGAWIWSFSGAMVAAFVAGKSARQKERENTPRVLREYPE